MHSIVRCDKVIPSSSSQEAKEKRAVSATRVLMIFFITVLLKLLQIYLLLLNYTLRLFLPDEGLRLFNAPLPPIIPLYLGLADAVYVAAAVDVGVDGLGGIAVDVATTVNRGVDVQAV